MPDTIGLQALDYVAVAAYLAATALIAWRASRRTSDTEDFFLGGRQMPWFVVGLSIMATLLSTNTYLGAPGEMIRNGPAFCLGYAAYPLVYLVVAFLWIPFFMRLRLTSAYEYLERRFDVRARALGDVLFLAMRLGWMSMVVYTASLAMAEMAPGPLGRLAGLIHEALHPAYPVIVLLGVAATVFACVGGIKAVIWTDVLQAAMLFGGVGAIIGFTMWSEGTGPAAWWAAIRAEGDGAAQLRWVSGFDVTERTTVLWAFAGLLAWHCCTHCCDQVALQRYFSTTSATAARRSFVVNLVGSVAMGLLLAVSGLALRYYYMRHPESLPAGLTPTNGADKLMPRFFADVLPAGLGGLIFVSFLCDALQTLASGVNSIAAIIGRDAADHGAGPAAGRMRFARATTILVGAATTVLAVGAAVFARSSQSTIFDMLPRIFNMFLGPLAVLFMTGMFFRRATAGIALTVTAATLVFSVLWSWWGQVPGLLTNLGLAAAAERWTAILGAVDGVPRTPSVLLAIPAPLLVGLLAAAVTSALLGRRDHPGVDYTWRSVMARVRDGRSDRQGSEPR